MVKKDFYRITILAAAVFSSTAVFSNESMKPPTRPEISIPATSIPQRPAPLSEKDKLDLDELVKVAKMKRAEYEKNPAKLLLLTIKKSGRCLFQNQSMNS
ncbi:hypothetical protein AB9K36_03845 [Klebsiella michiganensis]